MQGATASIDRDAAASLIRWWRDAGVDTLVDDAPRNWLAKVAPPAAGEAKESPSSPRLAAPSPAEQKIDLPDSLDALLAWMRDGDDVPEAGWGRTRILPAGDSASGLMILTDMPEPGDAEAGRLLSGDLGDLFDKMMAAIGHDRTTIWLSPLATIRSIGRFSPPVHQRLAEIARHHIALVRPRRLLIMGEQPNKALIGADWQARRGEIQRIDLGAVSVEAVSTFHPRLLADRPAYKKQAWNDLQLLMKGF